MLETNSFQRFMNEVILLSVRQHVVKYFLRLPRWIFIACVCGLIGGLSTASWIIGITLAIGVLIVGLMLEWQRFIRSTLDVTNTRVYLRVSKGLMSGFEAGLHYRQIKNCTFRKQHLLHTMTNSGTLYLRAGADEKEQIIAEYVPNVEKVSKIINWMLALSEDVRMKLDAIPTHG